MDDGSRRRLLAPAIVIGIGLGGFFDGILLHQVLQWHHLLSLVPGSAFRDLGTQILADGLFHVLMYLVTLARLVMLWRRRRYAGAANWRYVSGAALLGFALWNAIDVGIFHWLLGIHRIRIATESPLAYDLVWLTLFGAIPLAAALKLLRPRGGGRSGGGRRAANVLSLTALLSAALAALPVPGARSALVIFPPGTPLGAQVDAALDAGSRILWADPGDRVMAVSIDPSVGAAPLHARGALLVSRSPALAGCAAAMGG